MSIREYFLARVAVDDPEISVRIDIGKTGFAVKRIVDEEGETTAVLLHNGSLLTATFAELLGAVLHISHKTEGYLKLKFVGGDLTEVK